ncbi:prolyl oligopeptidase family serine peptidase [Massilia sp. PWRC2]|uniref:prolyl oligopeptidase family serine peptidase n=1 Tax=Massilia sp. PWRC2 TaxID=2804626 RepID=UPI003CEEFAEE
MHITHASLTTLLVSLAVNVSAASAAPAPSSTLPASNCAPLDAAAAPLRYPVSLKGDQQDTYHGTVVADPYRWLEDANSAQTKAWVAAQNLVTQAYLAQIPARAAIGQRLTTLWNYERYSVPFKEGGRYFYSRNDGLQNQAVLYTMAHLADTPRVLLDPNTLAADGTVALSGTVVSPDGKLLAYGTAASGSDWNEWRVRDIASGKDRDDLIRWVKFSATAWSADGKGFFYSRYDAPNEATKLADANYNHKLYYHLVGTPQAADRLVYQRPDQKSWLLSAQVTDDGHYLLINASNGSARTNAVFLKDLRKAGAPVTALLDQFDAGYHFVDNDGARFYFTTDQGAPRGRLVAIDVNKPAAANWKTVLPESERTLQSVALLGRQFVAQYLADAHSVVSMFDRNGKLLRDITLPGLGSVAGFGGRKGDTETFYSYSGFTTPATIYRLDLNTGASSVLRQPKVDFDPAAYETRQQFFTSGDGTRVPMFIVAKKGLKLDGSNPTYLYGYGGFNIALTPAFSAANIAWMEMGGVYVLANLRGGGEYGEAWHEAGTKLQKQNVFDDFIGAAEWLIANKVTSPAKLAIGGGSNGGLLVGAAMTQRPELFAAAIPQVGVLDMLRFQKFTIGWAWVSDYGSSDDPAQFKALYAYSPLHNLKAGVCLPATMITTADHDDRVVPAHSFKFAAAAQAAQGGARPVIIRIDTKAGHGAGKPTDKQIEEVADRWGFLTRALQMDHAIDQR